MTNEIEKALERVRPAKTPPLPPPPAIQNAMDEWEKRSFVQELDRVELAAESLEVTDDNSLDRANQVLQWHSTAKKALDSFWDPRISMGRMVYQMLLSLKSPLEKRLKRLREVTERKMVPYLESVRHNRAELQEKVDEASAQIQRDKLAAAKRAMMRGNVVEARLLRQEAEQAAVVPVIPVEEPQMSGSFTVENWKIKVTDPLALARAIAEGKAPIELIKEWDQALLRKKAIENNGLDYPGVEAKKQIGIRVQSRYT